MIHGDSELVDDTVRVFCQQHGWVAVRPENWPIHFTREHNNDTGCLPMLDDPDQAVALARELVADHEEVSVFWDRGWGDAGQDLEISIIVNGNGQNPRALMDAACYDALLDTKAVGPNVLNTFKARRVHDFDADVLGWRTTVGE